MTDRSSEAPPASWSAPPPARRPPSRLPRSPPGRQTILFLAAAPDGITRLALDDECAEIERELRMAPGRYDFDFRSEWAVSVGEMMRHLNEWQPAIVHFSGHGGAARGIHLHRDSPPHPRDAESAAAGGIQLQESERRSQYVTERALARMIESAAPSTRLVVLNACFSDAAAGSICGVVDCVVGMAGVVGDRAARVFAASFYRALGHRRSVGNAVAQGIATLAAMQLPEEQLPVCRTRDGVSADRLYLGRRQRSRSIPRGPLAPSTATG